MEEFMQDNERQGDQPPDFPRLSSPDEQTERALSKRFCALTRTSAIAVVVLLSGAPAIAQDSRFGFDPTGNLSSEFTESPALPQIIGQPQMQVVIPGDSASFSVVLADTTGVSYQWYFISTAIPGATADSLLVANASTNNQGPYWVVVSNALGSVASTLANLYIDSRGCGMPDSWQLEYFGNLNQNPLGDFDGDGISNLQEFLDGTNPTNAASALYHLSLVSDGGTVVVSPDQPTYTNGQVVALTATGSGSTPFHAWTGDVVTRSNSITVTMTTNRTLFAHFLPITFVWTNTAGGDWNVAANWSPNLVPGSNESVLIGGGTSASSGPTITENSNVDLVDFTFGSSTFIPVLTGSGRITISGTGIWNTGTMSGTGSIVVLPGASMSLPYSPGIGLVFNRTLENAGSVTWGGGNLELGGVITNDAGAEFEIGNPASLTSGGTSRFDNAGTLILANGATTFNGVAFNDYGMVDFPGGTLTLSGGGDLAGPLVVPAGSALQLQGGIFTSTTNLSITGGGTLLVSAPTSATLSGTINVTGSNIFSGGSVDFTGNYTRTNTMTISGATASFDGTGTVSPSTLTLSGGTLGGAQTVTARNSMSWTGGNMSGTGRTLIPPGASLTVNNLSTFNSITSRTLDNGGTTTWAGASIVINGGVITNEPGALFQVQSPASFNGDGSERFDNAGTLLTMGSGTIAFSGVALNNFNLVEVQGSTLALRGGGNNAGSISVPAGTVLNYAGGTFTTSGNPSVSGTGMLLVSGSTSATLGGTVNVSGSNIFSGTSVDFTGNYTCTNTMVISGGTASFDGTGTVSPSTLTLSGGTLGGAQTVTARNSMSWIGGNMSGTGRTLIPPGASLTVNNLSTFNSITSRTLDNGGTTTWAGASIVINGGVITNEPGALFQVQSPASFNGGGSERFDNAGTLLTMGSGKNTFAGFALNNFNLVEIQGGTLALQGGNNAGTMSVPAGTVLNYAGGTFTTSGNPSVSGAGMLLVSGSTSATLGGTVNVSGSNIFSGTSVDFTGNYTCTNIMVISGGTASFDGTGTVSPSILNLSGGTLGGAQTVTARNSMSWIGGNMSGTGRTLIPSGASLTVSNLSTFNSISSRTLDNGGTATWAGASITMIGGVITNEPGALFQVQSPASINFGGGSPRFDNAGTFRKSVTPGTFTFTVPLNNNGTVDIEIGTLFANGGGYVSSSNAVLNCALAGTTAGTNYGQLKVGGSVTLNGTLSVNLINNYIPTTNDSFTLVTAGIRNGAFSNFIYPSNQVAMVLSNTPTSVIVRATEILALPQPFLFPPQLSGTNVLLTWTSVPNGVYRLQFNPDLSPTNWSALVGDVTAVSNTASKKDTLTSSNGFYRVLGLHP
jgi:hypothetical protein